MGGGGGEGGGGGGVVCESPSLTPASTLGHLKEGRGAGIGS